MGTHATIKLAGQPSDEPLGCCSKIPKPVPANQQLMGPRQLCVRRCSQQTSGLPIRPMGHNAELNGLVAADMTTLVSHVLESFSTNTCDLDGLFVMTTATDDKNSLNRSAIKKTFSKTLRVETIANSAGGTAAVAMVMQPSTGFLNGRFLPDGTPTEDTEDCLGRITVGLTRSKSLTIIVSPLDMVGMIGMAQVLATLAYGISGLRRGTSTCDWLGFHQDPQIENNSQMHSG